MIFHYRCPRPSCRKPYKYDPCKTGEESPCTTRQREVACPYCMMKMTPDGITYDKVIKCQTEPKPSGEREPSSSGNADQ